MIKREGMAVKGRSIGAFFKRYLYFLWFPLYILWLEGICRMGLLGRWEGEGLWYLLLFSLALGGFLDFLTALGPYPLRRGLTILLSALLALWMSAQLIYHTIFTTFLTLFSVGNGAAALQFWRDILLAMEKRWPLLLLVWLPFLLMCILGRRWLPRESESPRAAFLALALALALQLAGGGLASHSTRGATSAKFLYENSFLPDLTAERFGLLTTLRLDCKQLLFGVAAPELPPVSPSISAPRPTPLASKTPPKSYVPVPVVYEPNIMDIDFASLEAGTSSQKLKAMHQWFSQRQPTLQNEYTGAWAGKNLIFIVAEGFSRYAITPETTPTLYRLSQEGFVCDQYYNPLWWVSTSDGEYAADTSLIPKPGVWSMATSSDNLMRFCLGNQLRSIGYSTQAYHNHTYTYYKRHLSHPNLGYDYKGLGNGLDVKATWPESDVEMMELTIPEYIENAPFHTYYMTVSGHMNYTFMGNTMATKHRDEVGHEDLCEEARAYLACQMELDRAVEFLLEELEAAGELENTAIVLTGDHYPYSMSQEAVTQLVGHQVEPTFETFLSTLILWSGDMAEEEPVHITKPVCSLDILPTVSNLMGLEYDSRLLMGRDALSDTPGLVVLSSRSFITDLGRYDASTGVFTPNEGVTVPEDYPVQIRDEVARMFTFSAQVLEQDYYRVLFGDE